MEFKNKLIIIDSGDPSVGIPATYYELDVPFEVSKADEIELEQFADTIINIYIDYAQTKLTWRYE